MENLSLSDVQKYIEENIDAFHQQRISCIEKLQLNKVLKKKNPYLFNWGMHLRHTKKMSKFGDYESSQKSIRI